MSRPCPRVLTVLWVMVLLGTVPALAQISDATAVHIGGDEAEVSFAIGGYGLDLTVSFDEVIGLTASSLGLSVEIVDPLDTTLASRLPGTLTSIPLGFPVLVTIAPPDSEGLAFAGPCTVEIYTHDLTFTAGTPLRIFKAPSDGDFVDITSGIGTGSYRARGQVGDFSEFLILADFRSSDAVIEEKFDRLEDLLDELDEAVATVIIGVLSGDLTTARGEWEAEAEAAAVAALKDFEATVEAEAGTEVPEIWRSSRDLRNAAGELLGAVSSLIFSLHLAS